MPDKHEKLFFWIATILTSCLLWVQLLFFGPQYELDTQFYLTGALHWDVQHPPLFGFWVSSCYHILPSIYLPLILQIGIFSYSYNFLVFNSLKENYLRFSSSILLGIEPISSYFHVSLLPESLLLSCFCVLYCNIRKSNWLLSGLVLAIAVGIKFQSLWLLPGILIIIYFQKNKLLALLEICLPTAIFLMALGIGNQVRFGGKLFNNAGGLLFPHTSYFYSDIYADSALQQLIRPSLPIPQDVYQRYELYLELHERAQIDSSMFNPKYFIKLENKITQYNIKVLIDKPLRLWWQIVKTNLSEFLWGNYLIYSNFSRLRKPLMPKFVALDELMFSLYHYKIDYRTVPIWWEKIPNKYIWLLGCLLLLLLSLSGKTPSNYVLYLVGSYFFILMGTVFFYKTRFLVPIIPLILIGNLHLVKSRRIP